MSLIYITGVSGSGKSEVIKELKSRGYETYGTDEDGLAGSYDRVTNKRVVRPENPEERTPAWRSRHIWKMPRNEVERLAREAENKPIFLIGTFENDTEVWDLFSEVGALVVDEETLLYRIANREDNNFGQNPHELKAILEWQETAENDYRLLGASIIDATQPIDKVTDEVVALAGTA